MKVRQFAVSAKMWYSGSAVTMISSPSSRSAALIQVQACMMLATMLPWVSIAPLATPGGAAGVLEEGEVVVPEGDRVGGAVVAGGEHVAEGEVVR